MDTNPAELLDRIQTSLDDLERMRAELAADPALANNAHWRENLDMTGYQVGCMLSTEDA